MTILYITIVAPICISVIMILGCITYVRSATGNRIEQVKYNADLLRE